MPFLLIIYAILSNAWAGPHLPQPLTEWADWILEERPEVQCIDHAQRNCTWQGSLQIRLAEDEMQFTQKGLLDAPGWVQLLGDHSVWPINIQVNSQHLPVLERDGVPQVYVPKGSFIITGTISWNTIPYQLQVPSKSGIIRVLQNEQWRVTTADQHGIVILSATSVEPNAQPPIIQVSRLWTDANPPTLLTQLNIQNIGTLQQISLGQITHPQTPLIEIDTQLPYWFDNDELWISVPTGTHTLSILNTTAIQDSEIQIPKSSSVWPDVEYWAIEHAPDLRQIRVQNLTPVSFEQTHLPSDWSHMSVYRRNHSDHPIVEEIHRADPTPPRNTLHLTRTLWPNLHDNGFWLKDRIHGIIQRPQIIESNDKTILQLKQDEHIQTIFEHNDQQHVYLNHRDVNVTIHAQTNAPSLSIQDWSVDFDTVTLRLQMPEEWKLLYWNGWIWTSYTILLGVNILLGMAVGWWSSDTVLHRGIYGLGILTGALFAPKSTLVFQMVNVCTMMITPLRSFMLIGSITWVGMAIYESQPNETENTIAADSYFYAEDSMRSMKKSRDYYTQQSNHNFGIQLGMGLPNWQGQEIIKQWQDSETQSQPMTLGILRSTEQRFLALIAGICLVFGAWRRSQPTHLILLFGFCLFGSSPSYAENSSGIETTSSTEHSIGLSESDTELIITSTFPDKCKSTEECVDISLSTISLDESKQEMTIWMEVHAIEDAILTLPGPLTQWIPHTVRLEEKSLLGIRRNSAGYLETKIPEGVWSLELIGTIGDNINLDWPTKPHMVHVTSNRRTIQGINSTGQLNGVLSITDVNSKVDTNSMQLHPHITWRRQLIIGSTWQIHHTLQIHHSLDNKTLQLPLLSGEIPQNTHIISDQNHWLIPIQNQEHTISWISNIPIAPTITLDFPAELLEMMTLGMEWSLDCQSQYICKPQGLAPIRHVQASGEAIPTWVPYPDESLEITIQSLTPSKGDHVQISQTELDIDDQPQTIVYTLKLALESSQTTEIPIELPKNSEILEYSVNQQQRHFKQDSQLTIFSDIGEQEVLLKWSLSKQSMNSTIPMPTIQGSLSNPTVRYHSNHKDILWANTLWEQSLPNSILWIVTAGLMALALARHPKNTLSYQTWLLTLIGVGHTNPWLWIPFILMLVLRHFIQQHTLSLLSGLMALGMLLVSPLSLLVQQRSLWIWNRTDLQWYTDFTDTIPPLTIIGCPSWILYGLWGMWWFWMLWMLGTPLVQDLIATVTQMWNQSLSD